MNVLVVSTMYPSSAQPVHAVFVEQRVCALARIANVIVVSPIPWFPLEGLLPRYAHRRRIPRREERNGISVSYPRFLSVPKFLKPLDGFFSVPRVLGRGASRPSRGRFRSPRRASRVSRRLGSAPSGRRSRTAGFGHAARS